MKKSAFFLLTAALLCAAGYAQELSEPELDAQNAQDQTALEEDPPEPPATEQSDVGTDEAAGADSNLPAVAAPEQTAPEPAAPKTDTPAAADELPKIAVYVTGSGVPEEQKKALGTRMLAALVNSGRYNGVERTAEFLEAIDKEHIAQRSGAVDDSQISELGKQFGVKYVCIADITPLPKDFQISARIVDVETARVIAIGDAYGPLKTTADLRVASDEVVRIMFKEKAKDGIIKLSLGGGLLLGTDLGGGITTNTEDISMPYTGGGAYIFIDADYIALSVSYSIGGGKWNDANPDPNSPQPDELSRSALNIGLYAKYPISITPKKNIKLFPLAGVEYEMAMAAELTLSDGHKIPLDGGYETQTANGEDVGGYDRPNKSDLNAMRFNLGCGIDYNINRTTFLRAELMYGIRTGNALENMYVEESEDGKIKMGHGLTLKVGVGVKL
jgi:hypothetical protein